MYTGELKKESYLNQRYRIYRKIGQGGFGITYTAKDETLEQDVVIKEYFPLSLVSRNEAGAITIPEDSSALAQYQEGMKRFLEEARTLASLFEVPGVVKVLDYFKENQTAYIVMEYVKGISLRSYLERREEPFSFDKACNWLLPIMTALEKIHKKGLVHRDISPDNLMVEEDGSIKLLDFGAARAYFTEQDWEKTMTILVKNGYAPPEQYEKKGKQGPWTDVYAICATLYEMMTGCMPQNAKERQITDELYPPSAFGVTITPEQEEAFLKRGLALEMGERYASVQKMQEAFFPEEKEKKERKARRRTRTVVCLSLCLCAGLLVVGCLCYRQHQKKAADARTAYAGNYDRGSREYKDFVKFVKEHAVQTETDEDATVYTLDEQAVRELGLVSNEYLLDCTQKKLIDKLKKAGYQVEAVDTKDMFEVKEEPYGVLRTAFNRREEYALADNLRMKICYDLMSNQIERLYIYPEEGSGADFCPLAVDVITMLGGILDGTKETCIKDMQEAQATYYQKNKEEGGYGSGYNFYEFELYFLFMPDTEDDVGLVMSAYGPDRAMSRPPYNWP